MLPRTERILKLIHIQVPDSNRLTEIDSVSQKDATSIDGDPNRKEADEDHSDVSDDIFDGMDDSDTDPTWEPHQEKENWEADQEDLDSLSIEHVPAEPGKAVESIVFNKKNRNVKNKGARKLIASRKLARNSGQAYTTSKGKEKKARCMKPLHDCRMKLKMN
ncbi:uncharacterized protein LOC120351889 [Nilaparvata lugens]|uniref:uncharacterized protein LOC120351889 n=1 Tax=Nilaparvata lugens TaxID=108931 RepID=UPI00193CD102|nr:uncharacterized protein LOC120351889 [Nilaparvata lugens]